MMATAPSTNGRKTRHTRATPCPICGGGDDSPRGRGERCHGFTTPDGWAHCSREEHAGEQCPYHAESQTWSHRLGGKCRCGVEHEPTQLIPKTPRPRKSIAANYDYTDGVGELLFQAIRYKPKGFAQRRPDPSARGGWAWNLDGVEPVLYRLPDLIGADPVQPVFVVEGEKDADRLAKFGLIATCNPMGAGKWRDHYAHTLRGRRVIVLPDNDRSGRNHVQAVARSLHGVAAEVRILDLVNEWPEMPEKGDVSDWLDHGGTIARLKELAAEAPAWEPPPSIIPFTPTDIPSRSESSQHYHRTDYGNSQRLVSRHGDDLRYCGPWGRWLTWDGRRWSEDETGQVARMAKQTVRRIAAEAASTDDDDTRKALLRWAISSESKRSLDAMVALAQSEPGIPVVPGDLDADPWLLNVANGTLDLRTGDLCPHQREDLITKLAPVPYDPDATCPTWLAFLDHIMNGDSGLLSYLQRVAGYALTGDIREHCLFFLYGTGRNGKSTFLNTIQEILGDYATTINVTLLTTKDREGHPTELCDLDGARFVSTIEIEDGRRLAEALVKSMTGGDPIKARRMRRDPYLFRPTFKLLMAANHKPEIRGTDEGIWSRIKMIPFAITIPKADRDKDLPAKLKAEAPGILKWMVEGCLAWQRTGLDEPEAVSGATDGYRAEMDVLSQFLDENCMLGPHYRCRANGLYDTYRQWCEQTGTYPLSSRKLGTQLNERGYPTRDSNGVRWRLGIGLRGEPHQQDDNFPSD